MIKLPSERKILRVLSIIVALLLYGGTLVTFVVIALFFDWLPPLNRVFFLVVSSISLLALKYILSHLKELMQI
jgi:hypothetical protein